VFGDDCEDVNLWLDDVVKHTKVVHAKATLGLTQTAKTFDASFAFFARLMSKVSLDGRSDARAVCSGEPLQVVNGFGCEDEFVGHSGQNVARIARVVKNAQKRLTYEN